MNAHVSEHVYEDENEVAPAIVLRYVGGNELARLDEDARGCVFPFHAYVHDCG